MVVNILSCNKFRCDQYISTKILNLNHVHFSHQGLEFWGRTRNHQWSCRNVSRGEGRKRNESHILQTSRTMVIDATPS
jgi:hypothetical protein